MIIEAFIICVAFLSGLPPAPPPVIEVLPLSEIIIRYPRRAHNWAWYEPWPRPGKIVLRKGYEHLKAHELTHHLQSYAGVKSFTPKEEPAAMEVQRQWAAGKCDKLVP